VTRTLAGAAADQARRRPHATALVAGAERLTYGALDAAANRLARALGRAGCRPGDRVGLLLPKSVDAVVAILGVLRAGGIYVPLDAASPAARLARMVECCRPRLVMATAAMMPLLDQVRGLVPCSFDAALTGPAGPLAAADALPVTGLAVTEESAAPLPPLAAPDDPAYILFTSGSTGMPKGVVVRHRNAVAFVAWATRHFGMGPDDRVSAHAPFHFDLSVFDLFGALAVGAELHLVPPALNVQADRMAEFIRTAGLTQWFSVPSLLTYLVRFDAVKIGDFPALRRLLWCGEVLPTPVLMALMERLPHVRFTNLYGPTETTVASSYHDVLRRPDDDRVPVPIGRACGGEELLVLDETLAPVPPGQVGDLYVGGAGVGAGYWNAPELTRAAFVPDPRPARAGAILYRTGDRASLDAVGVAHFHGRADAQVKSRGYRIELGEIESALHGLPAVREGAVVALPSAQFEGTVMACAYVARDGEAAEPPAVREALRGQVPAYMVPTRWLRLPALPRNANGKIDRRAIAGLFETHAAEAA
jgi:amino acid adenylation domain-containing protein